MSGFASWLRGWAFATDLVELVGMDTTSPNEARAVPWARERLEALGFSVRVEPFHAQLFDHPESTRHGQAGAGRDGGRCNVHAQLAERPAGVPVTLFNAHLDVVPPDGHPDGFRARESHGVVHGRGAADTKNNIVMLLGALAYVREAGLALRRDPVVDLVSDEEVGGNGTLSTVLHGREADEAVVLEPTGLEVHHGHRGCLGFEVTVRGSGGHMGGEDEPVNAIEVACDVVAALKELEAELLAEARDDPDFRGWRRPLQVNVGSIAGGQWHGSIPERCVLQVNFGFLPRYDTAAVRALLERRLADDLRRRGHPPAALSYSGLHNEAYVSDPSTPLFAALRRAGAAGDPDAPRGWKVSCDARFYARHLGIPTAIFGSGALELAHGPREHVELAEVERGMAILVDFLTGDGAGTAR